MALLALWGSVPAAAEDIAAADAAERNRALFQQGVDAQLRGHFDEARQIADRLIALEPETGIGETLHLNSFVTRLAWDPGDRTLDEAFRSTIEAARALCESNLEATPDDADIHYRCGQMEFAASFLNGARDSLLRAAVQGTRAIDAFERALALDPSLIDPRLQLGMAWYYADNLPPFVKALSRVLWFIPRGNSDRSLAYIEDVIRRGNHYDDVARFVYSDIARQGDDVDPTVALAQIETLVTRYPENARLHLSRIHLLLQLDQPERALNAARHGLTVADPEPVRTFLLGLREMEAALALGRTDEALAAFDALPDPPELPGWATPRYLLARARAFDLRGERDAAIAAYEAVLASLGRYRNHSAAAPARAGLEAPFVVSD